MNLEYLAKEAFQILRSMDYEVFLFDDDGTRVYDPPEARKLYAVPENIFVSIIDQGEDTTLRCYVGKSTRIESILGLVDSLRTAASKYNVLFNIRKYNRDLTPKEISTKIAVTEEINMNILEGMYGTSRSSYLTLENARMIVRHSARVNEEIIGARGRNVDSIYIENAKGERKLFPTRNLSAARAMTHHVNRGGSWNDETGGRLERLAEDYANVLEALRHIGKRPLAEAADHVRECLREKVHDARRVFEGMCRRTRHEQAAEKLGEMTRESLNEFTDPNRLDEIASVIDGEGKLDEMVLESVSRFLEDVLLKKADDAEKVARRDIHAKSETPRDENEPAATDAVKEFEAWIEGFDPDQMFEEDRFREPNDDGSDDAAIDELINDFDFNDFLRSDYADLFMVDMVDVLGDDEKTFTKREVVRALSAYLEYKLEIMDISGYDMTHEAEQLFAEVKKNLEDGGYIITEGVAENAEEDDVLSGDDVVYPDDPSEDLYGEVEKSVVREPGSGEEVEADQGYASRLMALAGINRTHR